MSWRTCNCARCRVRGLMGPAVLITIGILAFVDQYFDNWNYSFWRLAPIILIVIGVIQVLCAVASCEGHAGPAGYWQNPPQTPPQAPPQAPPQR
jgi:cell wall-active antibiotic response 4TMS protein YvqF